jgi:hypothetical protein
MNYLSMLACSILLAAGGLFLLQGSPSKTTLAADAQSDQVEVKTDRYSEATTVKLKPQLILDTPDHFITMRLEAKFGEKKIRSEMEMADTLTTEGAMIWFDSQAKIPTDFGDRELHFIVDGKRIKIGESSEELLNSVGKDPDLKPGFKINELLGIGLNTDQLKQIASGNRVEMRLGKYEFVLSPSVLGNWKEYVREFVKHAPSTKFKEKRS